MAIGDSIVPQKGEDSAPGKPVTTRAAWKAVEQLAVPHEWQHALSSEEQQEIIEAAKAAVKTGKPIPDLKKEDFPLPTLGPKLEAIREEAVWGRGFQLLRGFPIDRLNRQEVVTAWAGFGLHWGELSSQNAKGHIVGHIKDLGVDPDAVDVRIYATHAAQPWHVDGADLVALLCLKTAKKGGRSGWASSAAIYNHLLETRPDLVEELSKHYYWDRRSEEGKGHKPYLQLPVFSWYEGFFNAFYNDLMIKQAQRFPEVPRLTEKQLEALQAVTDLANDPEFHLEWDLQPGDVQLIHNWNQLHMRTEYEDNEGFDNRRHLLRLWVTPPNARPLNPELYGPSIPGKRLGIYREGTVHTAPLDAE